MKMHCSRAMQRGKKRRVLLSQCKRGYKQVLSHTLSTSHRIYTNDHYENTQLLSTMQLLTLTAFTLSVALTSNARPAIEKRQDFFTGFCNIGSDGVQTCTSAVVGGKTCDPNAQVSRKDMSERRCILIEVVHCERQCLYLCDRESTRP